MLLYHISLISILLKHEKFVCMLNSEEIIENNLYETALFQVNHNLISFYIYLLALTIINYFKYKGIGFCKTYFEDYCHFLSLIS